eukprot:2290225-Prymnesium_polylepis.1
MRVACDKLPPSLARVDDRQVLLDGEHCAVVVRLGAVVWICRNPPEEEHELALAAKRCRKFLDCDAVEADVVAVELVVPTQRARIAQCSPGRRVQRRNHLLSELDDLIAALVEKHALQRL